MKVSRRTLLKSGLAMAAGGALPAQGFSQRQAAWHVPWLAEVQTPPDQLPANAPKLPPLLVDASGKPIRSLDGWEAKREALRKAWLDFLRPLNVERKTPKLEVLEEDRPDGVIRQLVRYHGEPGIPVEGYLLRPAKAAGKRPGVVVMHSTVKHTIRQPSGVEGVPEKAFWTAACKTRIRGLLPAMFPLAGRR